MRTLLATLLLLTVASFATAQPLPTVLSPPSVTLTWDAPADMSSIAGWQMQRCLAPTSGPICTPADVGGVLPVTPRTWTDTPLQPDINYMYTVVAVGANTQRSVASPVFVYTVPPLSLVPAPTNLRLQVSTP